MKKLLMLVLAISILFGAESFCAAKEVSNGPFGLTWGSSIDEVRALGIQLTEVDKKGRLTICMTTSLPKNLSIGKDYVLLFDSQYGLQKAIMISKAITDDVYGTKGKKIYSRLKLKLSKKYGTAELMEYVGEDLYNESDEFYQCLKYPGCGDWLSYFDLDSNGFISLKLEGLRRGEGHIVLLYEGPMWSKVIDAKDKNISNSDDQAL